LKALIYGFGPHQSHRRCRITNPWLVVTDTGTDPDQRHKFNMTSAVVRSNQSFQNTLTPRPDDELVAVTFEVLRAYILELEVETFNQGSKNQVHFRPGKTIRTISAPSHHYHTYGKPTACPDNSLSLWKMAYTSYPSSSSHRGPSTAQA
jgi:hypothetical protein